MTESHSHSSPWIDISVPLRTGLVHWPGDPEPTFEHISEIGQGSEVNVTFCKMTADTGTRMDAPCHFLGGAAGIDQMALAKPRKDLGLRELPE